MGNWQISIGLMLAGLFIPLTVGCSRPGPTTVVDDLGPTAQEERLANFDGQLGKIHDESTAKTALTTLADYVEGSPEATGPGASSVKLFSANLIDKLAQLEVKSRQMIAGGVKASDVNAEEGVITIDKVTKSLNQAKDPSIPEIQSSSVEFLQAGIRSELPNIAPSAAQNGPGASSAGDPAKTNIITPIEALVIGYVAGSGDDGSAGPGANKNSIQGQKVTTFIDQIIE